MPVSGSITIPNETILRRVYVGAETQGLRGTAVSVDHKWYGNLQVDKQRPLVDREEFLGTYDAWHTPVYGPVTISGTYEQPLSYEDLAILLRFGVKGGVTGTSDAHGTTPSYLYDYSPSGAIDDLDTGTFETGVPGMVYSGNMLVFPQFTISADIDDSEACWKWSSQLWAREYDLKAETTGTATAGAGTTITDSGASWGTTQFVGSYVRITGGTGAGQVRRITSHTGTVLTVSPAWGTNPDNTSVYSIAGNFTTGINDRTRNTIDAPGTVVYIDDSGGTIGTTQVTQQIISWSVTWDNGLNGKRFMEDATGYSKKLGRGVRRVTGQIRMEFDTRDEYDEWTNKAARKIRIRKTGATINDTPNSYTATIDVPNAYWDTVNKNEDREGNITATFAFRAYYDSSTSEVAQIQVRNTLSALP